MLLPDKSPLYGEEFSAEQRADFRHTNVGIITSRMDRHLMAMGESSIILPGLMVNGMVALKPALWINRLLTSYVAILFAQGTRLARVDTVSEKFFLYENQNPYTEVRTNIVKVEPGFEGNGYGTGLLLANEVMMMQLANSLFGRVVAHHTDDARGAQQNSGEVGYRTGWTSFYLEELGYSNEPGIIDALLGDQVQAFERNIKRHWVKLLKRA
jgi:hypothetical protein